jgi:hypothetical protein
VVDKGAELGCNNEQLSRYELRLVARSGIDPEEDVLGRVYGGLKQAVMLRVLARRGYSALHRKVRREVTGERGRWSSRASAAARQRIVRGHVVTVWLSQSKDAEGLRPMRRRAKAR